MAGVLKLCTSAQVHILLAAAKIDESGDCAVPAVIRLSTRSFERVTQLVPTMVSEASLGFASYFILGTGLLAPWNALITGVDYMQQLFPVSATQCGGATRL